MMLFWVVIPWTFIGKYQCFGETYCLYLQGLNRVREKEGKGNGPELRNEGKWSTPIGSVLYKSLHLQVLLLQL
jgi:hypothetical protein